MTRRIDRRDFVRGAGAAGLGLWAAGNRAFAAPKADKVKIGAIGVGGQGKGNLKAVIGEDVVAMCDVDRGRSAEARQLLPDVPFYADYRELLDTHAKDLDAVVVSTPDHMHAPIAIAAMKLGLHAYCEKPLTWSVQEAREMARIAREKGLATQMGNQGTAAGGFRSGVEALRAGVIGDVTEVIVWTNRPVWRQAVETPTDTPPVPDGLSWDLFLGAAPERAYHPWYHPFAWRGWYDYGTGALGDMACHTVNLAYMGLDLGAPTTVEAETTRLFEDSYPAGAKVTFEFPARGERPPVTLTWLEGEMKPPADLLGGTPVPNSGCLIVGEHGNMSSANDYGSRQGVRMNDGSEPVQVEPTLPRARGHHAEWLAACRGEGDTLSNFGHAGPFTEAVLLGNLAMRLQKKIEWDAEGMKAKGVPEADELIRREYRAGFSI